MRTQFYLLVLDTAQTRPVEVLKFYLKGTVEERVLRRRQQRGELSVAVSALEGGGADNEACSSGGDPKQVSKGGKRGRKRCLDGENAGEAAVSSTKVMALGDFKLLFGV